MYLQHFGVHDMSKLAITAKPKTPLNVQVDVPRASSVASPSVVVAAGSSSPVLDDDIVLASIVLSKLDGVFSAVFSEDEVVVVSGRVGDVEVAVLSGLKRE